jgi:malonyl CoA-acyl carrier protein transacylase
MKSYMFPGQGSQRRGMGEELFSCVPQYAANEPQIDALLGYSLRQLCLEDPQNRLNDTRYTQPSLYVINALHYYRLLAAGERAPAFLAGHSLGEYNALLAAGAFDFLTGLRIVQRRAELMAEARNGGMAAIIGLPPQRIAQVLADGQLTGLDVANYNSALQTVVSGPLEEIKRAGGLFEAAGAQMYVPLPVSAAFHSRYMRTAAAAFDQFLGSFTFASPRVPVIANVTAQPYPTDDPAQTIRTMLVAQITRPVRWTDTIGYLSSQGVADFVEVGPGKVLTNLLRQCRTAAPAAA